MSMCVVEEDNIDNSRRIQKGQGKTLNLNFLIFFGPQVMSQVGLDGEQKTRT
jgi:hypothetical protein